VTEIEGDDFRVSVILCLFFLKKSYEEFLPMNSKIKNTIATIFVTVAVAASSSAFAKKIPLLLYL